MMPRNSNLPSYVERSLLQKIRSGEALQMDIPYSRPTLARLKSKGWIEELDNIEPISFRVTPAGKAALKAKIPLHR